APAAVAVGRERESALDSVGPRILDAHDGGIAGARSCERVGADRSVVLLGDPALGSNRGRSEQLHKILGEVAALRRERKPILSGFSARSGRSTGSMVDRPFFGERMRGNLRGDSAVIFYARHAAFVDLADNDGIQPPLFEDGEDF